MGESDAGVISGVQHRDLRNLTTMSCTSFSAEDWHGKWLGFEDILSQENKVPRNISS